MGYDALHERFRRIGDLNHALAMLSWDEAVMMPAGSGSVRGEALATLTGMVHELTAAPETGELVDAAAAEELDPWQAVNVEKIRHDWVTSRAVPADLVRALSLATSSCEQTWRGARGENDWTAVVDGLNTVVDLTREKAQALAATLECEPYDALLDNYEPGLTRASIDPVFDELGAVLPDMVEDAIARQPVAALPRGPFSIERQEALGRALMAEVGFDFGRGRLDVSHHPFCGGDPDDTRITTRYNEHDFLESMFAVLHETGHAMYEQGLPTDWRGQPVGHAGGMALHESQSLLMEMQVCRGAPFIEFAAPIIQRTLLGAETDATEWQPANLVKLAAKVERGFIRVDADELTYPLHVILRYRLETALLDGSLSVAEIPDAWNEGMTTSLGLSTAGNFADGCMQDVHWFAGLIGYFPSYTLGALMAAQIFRAARDGISDLDDVVREGRFAMLFDWLREHVHRRGSIKPSLELVADVTGCRLGTSAFLDHLRTRYGLG
ncbi:MAG: carboxypeptidase M32 [Gammaproteobacteria bacterium]|nr:carboxypeptidase M32 [Gammaproteobacteria bacterium]MYF30619.1 carboxypeptidase M32 [Gammaproteobacteria bacterium]MYK46598.1 carboxypeptidase M32 [Gammaproteobacteria bacterium]